MNQPNTASELPKHLQKLYSARFEGQKRYRNDVWRILTSEFFSRWIKASDTIFDLGCGYGEFINNVVGIKKIAMDLNPSAKSNLQSGVEFIEQDCSLAWPVPTSSLDVVFSSNFFEHLPNKAALQATLTEAFRCLKPNGHLIALGPNIKYLHGEYWDFFDHYLPLTELSLSEVLKMCGFRIERSVGRFLPYSMSLGSQPSLWKLRLFLKLPMFWKLFGRQFLVVVQKPE